MAPVCYRHPDREAHIRCQRCDRPICPDCMRPASVGFQCPSCVAEGAKTTRSGRTTYGGRRSDNPALTSMVLIGINAAIWLLIVGTGGQSSPWFYRLALLPRTALAPIAGHPTVTGVADGAYWQLLTSMFTQVQILHIGFNMLALYVLGPQLELVLGRARFLSVYLLSGLTGSVLVYWLSPPFVPTIGASGAIFGLMGALLVVALKLHADVRQLGMWIGLNFLITVVGRGFISWQGHLGGFLGGVVLAALLVFAPRQHRAVFQVLALTGFAVLLLGATVARTAVLA
ncbi:MAG: rhomboid family intramembrane serine protease [Nocardioidaceae bacterium]